MPLIMLGGGTGSGSMYGNIRYNIVGPNIAGNTVNWHAGDSIPTDTLSYNTIHNDCYTQGMKVYGGTGSHNEDTSYTHHTWFKRDSLDVFGGMGNVKFKARENDHSTTFPEGVAGRTPTAVIVSNVDSGTVPLTVKFTATGSSDPDGSITTYYWFLGDSSSVANNPRKTTHDDTITYTYDEIGIYTIELMVVDNEGIPDWEYKKIKVKPESGSWFSAWVTDREHGKIKNFHLKQIYLDNWKIWEKDIAGANTWEHIVVDITDTLALKDSITIEFRLLCQKDTTNMQSYGPWMIIDNVHIFGANVVNGDFESGTWTGNYYGRDDGKWDGGYTGTNTYRAIETPHYAHGLKAYRLYNEGRTSYYSGDRGWVKQRVDNPNVP